MPETSSGRLRSIPLSKAALFLDIDGTLAHFAPTPLEVGPTERRTTLLRRLSAALDGRVAAVSGRSISDVDRIIEEALHNVAGVHGLQRRAKGGVLESVDSHPSLPEAASAFASIADAHPGALVELKPLSVALHYRRAPLAGPAVREGASVLALKTGLALQEGEMVVELLTPGRNKGTAVRDYMNEPQFAGATPIFVGDDITDEAAFVIVQGLGGTGVVVGTRQNTVAISRLSSVDHVLNWLENSLDSGSFQLEMSE